MRPGDVDPGWLPAPNVWVFPAGLAVLLVGGSWACDAGTAAFVRATGTGRVTHYLPLALGLLVALVAPAVVLFRRETARARREALSAVPEELKVPALPAETRNITVTAEALNLPKALPAHPSATYPMPHQTEVIDAEIIP